VIFGETSSTGGSAPPRRSPLISACLPRCPLRHVCPARPCWENLTVARRVRCRQPVTIDSRPEHSTRCIITVQRRDRELVAERHSVADPNRCGLVLLAPRRNPRQGNRTGHEPAHLQQGRPLRRRRVRTRLARPIVTVPTRRSSETATRKLRSRRQLTGKPGKYGQGNQRRTVLGPNSRTNRLQPLASSSVGPLAIATGRLVVTSAANCI
jgi:hypothetical protein